MGISRGSSLLCTVAIRTTGTGHTSALLVAGAGFGSQFTYLLSEFTAGEIRIGLTCNSCGTCGLLTGGFAVFSHRITSGQNQRTTGVLDGTAFGCRGASLASTGQLKHRGRTGRRLGCLSCTLATATAILGVGSNRSRGRFRLLRHFRTVAILACIGDFAATGQSLAASQDKIPAGVALLLDLGTDGRSGWSQARCASRGNSDGSSLHRHINLVAIGVGARRSCIRGCTHTIGAGTNGYRGFLTGSGQRLAAFKCEFATGESCHVRPRMST